MSQSQSAMLKPCTKLCRFGVSKRRQEMNVTTSGEEVNRGKHWNNQTYVRDRMAFRFFWLPQNALGITVRMMEATNRYT